VFTMNPGPEDRQSPWGVAYKLQGDGSLKELYRTAGWYSFEVFVSRDGRNLVQMGPWNSGQVPSSKDLAVAFHKDGKLVKSYSTTDLLKDPGKVSTSVSHYMWRADQDDSILNEQRKRVVPTLDYENHFTLQTIDGWKYVFDAGTGEILESFQFNLSPPAEPVALKNSVSPNGLYEVFLEADKDTPSYKNYKMQADESSRPAFLLFNKKDQLSSARTLFKANVNDGQSPLRNLTNVLWRADSQAVAINTGTLPGNELSLLVWNSQLAKFTEARLPDYEKLTGFPMPDIFLLTRSQSAKTWTPDGHLIYEIKFVPIEEYTGPDPLHHLVELSVSSEGCKVVKRLLLPQ